MQAIPPQFTIFKIFPKDTEADDQNMPKNLAHAVELFYRTNKQDAADVCRTCVSNVLDILQAGPDGVTEVSIGEAWLCWECGHVGIPQRAQQSERRWETPSVSMTICCAKCGEIDSINSVRGIQPDGSELPWIEKKVK
jgi:hypothetical protein